MRKLIGIVSAVTALLLVGCAGNIDESSENAADDGPDENVAEDSQELPYCYLDAAETQASKYFEAAALTEINKRRKAGAMCPTSGFHSPTSALKANASLHCAALAHSVDMAANNYFKDNDFDGTTPKQRVAKAGYTGTYTAQNIAKEQAKAADAVKVWMASANSCKAIMAPSSTAVGIGYFYSDIATYKHYWTAEFGK